MRCSAAVAKTHRAGIAAELPSTHVDGLSSSLPPARIRILASVGVSATLASRITLLLDHVDTHLLPSRVTEQNMMRTRDSPVDYPTTHRMAYLLSSGVVSISQPVDVPFGAGNVSLSC